MLYKDLTPKQQKHLQGAFKACSGFIPEDATHIDEDFMCHKNMVLKIAQNGDQYFLGVRDDWRDAGELGVKANKYFEIPEDFCRTSGDVLPVSKTSSEEDSVQSVFPGFSFKLSCGDRPEVRQWLKDNGCKWYNGEDITKEPEHQIKIKGNIKVLWVDFREDEERVVFIATTSHESYMEIEPIVKVTGYKLTEESKARKQKLDKITELRNNVKDIQKQIEELEKDLRGI